MHVLWCLKETWSLLWAIKLHLLPLHHCCSTVCATLHQLSQENPVIKVVRLQGRLLI